MIIILCGAPGAGKTTVAKKLALKLRKLGTVALFSADKLKPPAYKKFSKLLVQNRGKFNFFIFDATFYKKSIRKNLKLLAKGEQVITVFFAVSLKTALLRNKKRKEAILEPGLRTIFARLEQPTHPDIYIDTEKVSAHSAAEKIFQYARRYFKAVVPKKKRIFIALAVSPKTQSLILDWQKKHKKLVGSQVRWLACKNLHITLIPPWYQEENKITAIKVLMEKIKKDSKPFNIEFQRIQYGPDPKRPRLIWAEGDTPKEMITLKRCLEKLLKREPEKRQTLLHMTIARFQPKAFSSFPIKELMETINWKAKIRSVSLMESQLSSQGADYKLIAQTDFLEAV